MTLKPKADQPINCAIQKCRDCGREYSGSTCKPCPYCENKPKAEETLKACPMMARCVGSTDMQIIGKCPHRRIPAKDEGENRSACGNCWRGQFDDPCRLFVMQKCGEHNRYRHWQRARQPKPTAPADEGDAVINGDESMNGLKYIAESPPHDHGGFRKETIETAKAAINTIADLQAALAEVRQGVVTSVGVVDGLNTKLEKLKQQLSDAQSTIKRMRLEGN